MIGVTFRTKRDDKMNTGTYKTRIINLNENCLENIMGYLDFNDLTSLAVCNTRFQETAIYVYRHHFADQLIQFHSPTSSMAQYQTLMNILNAFGDHIRKLHVTFCIERQFDVRDQLIFSKINENCSKSLVELNLSGVRRNMIITKPFSHLRKLTITNSFLDKSIANLPQTAPQLTSLEYHNVENVFNDAIATLHLPLLTHFGNFSQIIKDPERELENLQYFRRFVNANKQLRSFGFGSNELSYMLKYKKFRHEFFSDMHPEEVYPDQRNYFTYLLPFESVYLNGLTHLQLRLGGIVQFLQILRHRRINIGYLPVEHLELHVDQIPREVGDLMIQFQHLKRFQFYLYNPVMPHTLECVIAAPFIIDNLVDIDLFLLNDEDYKAVFKPIIHDIGIMIMHQQKLKRVCVGFQMACPIDLTNIAMYEDLARLDQRNSFEIATENIPTNWRVSFETKIIKVQNKHGTQDAFVICVILTNSFFMIG